MDKKKIAKMFFESFGTTIKEIVTEGKMPGSGHYASGGEIPEGRSGKGGEIVFFNHAEYEKARFSADFNKFAKKLAAEYGVDVKDVKTREKYQSRTWLYKWDLTQTVKIDGLVFSMSRRMANEPHAILDGCHHVYYIDINDMELVDEIKKLEDERLAEERKKAEEAWPGRVEKAKSECREMMEELQEWLDGKREFDEYSVSRLHNAHFQFVMLRH